MERFCIICDSQSQYKKIFVKKGKDYLRCIDCGLIVVDPLPTIEEVKRYYDADYEKEEGMGTARTVAEFLFHATAKARIPQIKKYYATGQWLDIGCTNGAFLEVINASGYNGYGIDVSEAAVELARKKGLKVKAGTIETYQSNSPYDIVSAFDVIEHVLDPLSFLRAASEHLKPDGLFALTTPDTNSIMAKVMGSRWYEYIPETHFFNFNRKNLTKLLTYTGLDVIRAARAKKHINFDYGQIQFKEYNPLIYRVLWTLGLLFPRQIRQFPISFYIGEMLMIAKKNNEMMSASNTNLSLAGGK